MLISFVQVPGRHSPAYMHAHHARGIIDRIDLGPYRVLLSHRGNVFPRYKYHFEAQSDIN